MDIPVEIRTVETARELDAALAIRRRVFVREQGIPEEIEVDGRDERATHVLIFDAGRPVATGRVVVDGAEATLARIAVVPEARGRGLGRRIVEELERLAAEQGARRFELRPHDYLEPFYRRLGYARVSEGEVVAGHRLIRMRKKGVERGAPER